MVNLIESYSFGEIVVDGKKFTNDLKIFPDRVDKNWQRLEGHSLHLEDIRDVLGYSPEVFIVGTGAYGKMNVPEDVREAIKNKDIDLRIFETEEACDNYNEIIEEKDVVAALHLTC